MNSLYEHGMPRGKASPCKRNSERTQHKVVIMQKRMLGASGCTHARWPQLLHSKTTTLATSIDA